jgi:hypothetical protein
MWPVSARLREKKLDTLTTKKKEERGRGRLVEARRAAACPVFGLLRSQYADGFQEVERRKHKGRENETKQSKILYLFTNNH